MNTISVRSPMFCGSFFFCSLLSRGSAVRSFFVIDRPFSSLVHSFLSVDHSFLSLTVRRFLLYFSIPYHSVIELLSAVLILRHAITAVRVRDFVFACGSRWEAGHVTHPKGGPVNLSTLRMLTA